LGPLSLKFHDERDNLPAVGEMQVARVVGRDVCFVVIAVLSSDCRDAS
jgi:hypothetical protein